MRLANMSMALAASGLSLGLGGCASLRRLYDTEVAAESAKPAAGNFPVLSEASLAPLPEPVRRHFRVCGFLGRPAPRNARLEWSELLLKRAREKPGMAVHTLQFNGVAEPSRIVYMGARLFKVLPFEGRDKYQDGRGNMRIKVLGFLTVADEQGEKMDQSALVTVLAETFLVPAYALQPYIRCEAMDETRARATLTWKGTTVSGVFHFAPMGECLRFETGNRWQKSGDSQPVPWSAHFDAYAEQDGFRFPSGVRAVWHEKAGDFEYVRGRIARIDFDVGARKAGKPEG